MKLEIVRRRWARGHNDFNYTALHNVNDHRQCCLGFYARALGIPLTEIRNETSPIYVDSDKWPSWLVRYGNETAACRRLIDANDSDELTDEAREEKIRREFAKHGVKVVFK